MIGFALKEAMASVWLDKAGHDQAPRKRVLIDVDGVLADIHTPWLRRYNADWDDNLSVLHITKWEMHELVRPECGHQIYSYLKDPLLYAEAPVINGAAQGVADIQELGHEVIFVSAGFYPAKVQWLVEHGFVAGPWENARDVVLATNKALVQGDVIIDDYGRNLVGFQHQILFSRPWNRQPVSANIWRAEGWDGVVRIIAMEVSRGG